MVTLIFLVLVFAIVYRTMTPEARMRAVRAVPPAVRRLRDYGRRQLEPFETALRARTRWAIVAPALVVVQLAVMVHTGGHDDAASLLSRGANFGPRTTNGEWWRLLASTLASSGPWSFLVNAAALLQVGLMLERLVGPLAFSTTYLASGLCAGLVTIWIYPMAISGSAAAAICGIYGLMLTVFAAGRVYPSEVTIPVVVLKRLAPVSALFVVCTLADPATAAVAAFSAVGVGVVLGAAVTADVGVATPPLRRVAIAAGVVLAITTAAAFPLRGIADVRPEIERLVTVEHRTAGAYETALQKVRAGKASADTLIGIIERSIVPELQAAEAHLAAIEHVPAEDQQRVADARQYLKLRCESWQLRAETLRGLNTSPRSSAADGTSVSRAQAEARYRSMMLTRGRAETAERAAMDALDRIVHDPLLRPTS